MHAATPISTAEIESPPDGGVVILDTNVILDWLVFNDPRSHAIARWIADERVAWQTTRPMLDELEHVLTTWRVTKFPLERSAVISIVERHAQLVAVPAPDAHGLRCRDPDDQKFLHLALARPGAWLFTRDRALLDLRRRAALHGVRVLQPAGASAPTRPA